MPLPQRRVLPFIQRYGAETLARTTAAWDGFRLEVTTHRAVGRCEFDFCLREHGLFLTGDSVDAAALVEARFDDGRIVRRQMRAGRIDFLPAHHRSWGWSLGGGTFRVGYLFLEPWLIGRASGGEVDPGRLELAPALDLSDPDILHAMHGLIREIERPGPLGRVYAESLAVMALTALVRPHLREAEGRQETGVELRSVRHVIDFIDAYLDEDLSLFTLAAEAGLSPRHLARQLKRATGLSPHQYVLRRRVERAKTLLAQRDLSITDVALAVGFSSQAHLTAAFRRVYSITPGVYRDVHRARSLTPLPCPVPDRQAIS
jgi:AraC family transcriptional regulator